MTKKQLVRLLSYHYGALPVRVIQQCVDCLIEELTSSFLNKHRVEIRNFGVFSTKLHRGKIIRHPTSRRLVKLKDHYVVHFKPGKDLQN